MYRDKPYSQEVRNVIGYFESYCPETKFILDVGCGTGEHARHFCAAGYRVLGTDSSESMIREANAKNIENFKAVTGQIQSFRSEEHFDAAVSLFHVISYLENPEDLRQSFQNIHRHLKKGGLFVFDVWHTPAVLHLGIENRLKIAENDFFSISRKGTSEHLEGGNRVKVKYHFTVKNKHTEAVSSWTEDHIIRHFDQLEIGQLANSCGFEVLKSEELISKRQPDSSTWSVCYVLKKKDE